MNRDFSCLSSETISLYTDDITDVEQFFKNCIVKCFILTRTNIISADVDLDTARFVLKLGECCRPHDPSAHHPSGNRDLTIIAFLAFVI
jgi:hypothetical protein